MAIRVTDQDSFGRSTGALVSSAVGFSALVFVRRAADTNNFGTIIHMDDGGPTDNFQFHVQGNGETVGFFSNAGGNFGTGVDLVNDVWFAVAMSCSSSQTVTAYAKRVDNNGWDGTGSQASAITSDTYTNLEFGNALTFNSEDFNGTFAGAKIWTAELTSDELLLEAQRITPARLADLNSFYPMLPGTTERFRDYGPTGVTLALLNHVSSSVVSDEEMPPVPWGGRVHIIQPVSSGQSVSLGLVTETDTAFGITANKDIPLGLVTETDTAQAITANRDVPLGLVSEADTAFAIDHAKTVQLGLITETDSAFTITPATAGGQQVALGLVTETDTAFAVDHAKTVQMGLATETDSAFAITPSQPAQVTLGLVTETDTAFAITPATAASVVALGVVTETDTAFGMQAILGTRGVNILDNWTLVATAAGSASSAFPVSAGTNRVLIYQASIRIGTGITVTGVTYGGQTMTEIASIISTDAAQDIDNSFWFLNDAGIAAASGNTFTPTFSGSTSGSQFRGHAASYERVKQDGVVVDTDTSVSATSGGAPATTALTTTPQGRVIAGVANNQGTGTSSPDATWTVVEERIETAASASYNSIADLPTDGSDVTPGLSVSDFQRAAYVAFTLSRDSIPVGTVVEIDTAFAITPSLAGGNTVSLGLVTETDTAFSITPRAQLQAQILNAWTRIAVSSAEAEAGVSFPVSAGANRHLVVGITEESTSHEPTAVAYGGQAMTQVLIETSTGGFPLTASFWILNDAGIATATDSDVVVTFDGVHDGQVRMFAASYENTDQTSPVIDTHQDTAVGLGVTTAAVATSDRGIAVAMWNNSAPGVNATWTGVTEAIEEDASSTYTSIAWVATTGSAVTADPDPDGASSNNLIVFSLAGTPLEVELGLVSEADTTFDITAVKTVEIGQVSEVDTAFAITPTTATLVSLGLVTETDTAFAITPVVAGLVPLGLVTETDSAFDITPSRQIGLGLVSETDTAFGIDHAKTVRLGLITETDQAFAITIPSVVAAQREARARNAGSAPKGQRVDREMLLEFERQNSLIKAIEQEDEELVAIAPAIVKALMSMRR